MMVQVIFADGTFIDGSTSELSCDGPLREPYAVFCQVLYHIPPLNYVSLVCALCRNTESYKVLSLSGSCF